ncbi:MAG TPA: inositol monophosphatase family protein [Terriglobia bacterium]|nr:inositol monophosphatase family protein [Terriglobia bacterium]
MTATEGSPTIDPAWASQASAIARESGARLREFFTAGVETEYKGSADLVTVADRTVEALIRSRLGQAFPSHGIYGEEGTRDQLDSEYRWYVDPLDGTTNFAHGFPVFCVSIGLAYRNEVVAGVVYDPMREELFTAERGLGAYLNQQRIHVSKHGSLSESLVATGFPPFLRDHELNIDLYYTFTRLTHGVRRAGSAALDLCSVAAGRFEGFWELKLNPWDKAAGSLMVTEGGGRVTDLAGGPFELLGEAIFASNGLVHDQMLGVFSKHDAQTLGERPKAAAPVSR